MSCAKCPGLSLAISAQFTLKMCIAARDREKFTKTFIFRGLRSFKVVDVGIPKKLVASACYMLSSMSVPICNNFHVRQANSE